jgi:ligand-binding sensor domain-containing protein
MKRPLLILLMTAIISSCSNLLIAQWIQTNGPEGGETCCFASIDSRLFAGTVGGVYLSTNDGTNWTATQQPDTGLNCLAVRGTNLFAGTRDGVFLSSDYGDSWTAVNNGLAKNDVRVLTVNNANLFAGTSQGGVFLSINDGDNWTAVNNGLTNLSVKSLNVINGNLYAGTSGGLFLSTDNGSNWNFVGLPGESINALAIINTYLFAGTDNSGVFRSTDNGANWEIVKIDTNVKALTVIGTDLFVGSEYGTYLSHTFGASWIPVNNGITARCVLAIYVRGNNLFSGTAGGVFRSTNDGIDWTEVNTGLKSSVVFSLVTSGENLYAGTRTDMFRSDNGGNSWTSLEADSWIGSIAISGTNLYGGAYGKVLYSLNSGDDWDIINVNFDDPEKARSSDRIYTIAIIDSYIFAGSEHEGLFRINREPLGWKVTLHWFQPDTTVYCLAVSGKNLFAGTGNGVFLSSDYGDSWTAINNGLTNYEVSTLLINGSNLFAGTRGGGVFLSINDGASWTPVNTGLVGLGLDILTLIPSGSNLFAGTWRGGVFLSTNSGANWTAVNTGLTVSNIQPSSVVHSLAIIGANLYAGTRGAGVWRRPLSEFLKLFVSTNSISIGALDNSTATFNITSNLNWTVESSETWLTVSKTSGYGDNTITLTAQANTIPNSRTATIIVSSDSVATKTISITQEAALHLNASLTTLSLSSTEGATGTFNIDSNTNWTISCTEKWLTFSNASGHGDATIEVTARENWTINTRNATITISATGLPDKTIIVAQDGSPTGIDNTLPDANINVYPNPTTGIITIVYPKGKNVVFKLFDISGFIVKQVTDNDQDGETVLDLSRCPSGVIYCQVQVFDGTMANLKVLSGKIVVQ